MFGDIGVSTATPPGGTSTLPGGNVSLHTTTPGCPTMPPALPITVQTSITIIFTIIFSTIFVVVFIQLVMIRCYRYKCLSYQCIFLVLCLIWAGLRIALFSFYYNNAATANSFPTPLYWLLYCFPVCLQFITLCILVEFFTSQVVLKTRTYYGPNSLKRWHVWIIIFFCISIFLTTNIICAIIEQQYQNRSESPPFGILLARVIVNGALFMGAVGVLSVLLCMISRTSVANMALEAQGITVKFAFGACVVMILLYTSRVVYNLIAVIQPSIIDFGYNWVNVSDQVDFGSLNQGWAYVSYSAVLLAWEIVPTVLIVCFFRVKRRHSQMQMLAQITSQSYHRRYLLQHDEDGERERHLREPGDGSSVPGTSPINYESIVEVEFYAEHFGSYTQYDVPGTPPPLKIPHHDMLFDGESE